MMKKTICYFILLALSIFPIAPGCNRISRPSQQLKEKMGKEMYQALSYPEHVKIEGKRTLMQSEIEKLQFYLLKDKGYIFNRMKKCLFVPEFTITFEGKKQTVVLLSFICRQIKFVQDGQVVIIDIDPMAEELENCIKKEILQ